MQEVMDHHVAVNTRSFFRPDARERECHAAKLAWLLEKMIRIVDSVVRKSLTSMVSRGSSV